MLLEGYRLKGNGRSTSVREDLALQLSHAPELVYLPDLAAQDKDERGIVDPDDDDDDRRERARIERRGVECGRVVRERRPRELERRAAERRREPGRLRAHPADGQILIEREEHQRDE